MFSLMRSKINRAIALIIVFTMTWGSLAPSQAFAAQQDSILVTLTIAGPQNDDPVLALVGDREGIAGEWFVIKSITATDADGDRLTIEAEGLAECMRFFQTIDEAGYTEYKLVWPEQNVIAGTYPITLTVSDGNGGTDTETFTITINSTGNHDPVLRPITYREGVSGEWFVVRTIIADDVDADHMTMTMDSIPAGMRFFQTVDEAGYSEYRLRWPPEYVVAGEYEITVTVSDREGGTDSETFTIAISDNHPPVIDPIADRQVQEGEWVVMRTLLVTDADGDDITMKIDPEHSGMRFFRIEEESWPGHVVYRLRWPPEYVVAGNYDTVFTAIDAKGARSQLTVKIRVVGIESIEALPETGIVPLDVEFNTILTPNWMPTTSWQFGDGGQAVGENVFYTYGDTGDHDATAEATDGIFTSERTTTVRVFEDSEPAGLDERALFVWNAWNTGEAEGWVAHGGLEKPDFIGDGVLNTAVKDYGAYLESPVTIMDTSKYNNVKIRCKLKGADSTIAKVSWRTAGDTEFDPANEEAFTIINDGQFHTYDVEVFKNKAWHHNLAQLRFYPTTGTKGRVQVDYIKVAHSEFTWPYDIIWEFNPQGTGLLKDPVKQKELLDFCYVKGMRTIYLASEGVVYGTDSDKDDYTQFITDAHARGIDVWGLQGRMWWSVPEDGGVSGQSRTTDEGLDYLQAVLNYGQFDGIIDDTEPYTANNEDWNNNLNQRAQWYLDWVQGCKDEIDSDVQFISVIPFWFDSIVEALNGDTTPRRLNEYVSDVADSICIMDYRDFAEGPNGMIEHAQNEINYGPSWVAVEVQDLSGTPHADLISFYEEGEAYMEEELGKFRTYYSGSSNYLGTVIHYYDPYKRMKP